MHPLSAHKALLQVNGNRNKSVTNSQVIRRKSAFALCAWLATAFTAADAQTKTWYHVEVIVFEYLQPRYVDGEQWRDDVESLNLDGVQELIEELADFEEDGLFEEISEARSEAEIPMAFQRLSPEAYQLGDIAKKLMRAPNQQPLLHVAWRQPRYGMRSARSVHVRPSLFTGTDEAEPLALETVNGTLSGDVLVEEKAVALVEGVLRVRSGRQLHIDADFRYKREELTVRLTETRRVRLRELHYLDHPLFGLLVSVIPFIVNYQSVPAEGFGER